MAGTSTGDPLNLTKHDAGYDGWASDMNANLDAINTKSASVDTTLAVKADASAVTSGDSATLASAHTYTDTAVASEATARGTAVSNEATARASADSTTLVSAESYADGVVGTEATARIAADLLKAPLASPALTGTPTAPTAAPGTNTTQLATSAFVTAAVTAAINALLNGAPGALDTLKELADALNDDASFSATITTALALKAPLLSPALTGTPTAPTQTAADNSTKLATTAYADGAVGTEITARLAADALRELLSHKDAASGYAGLDSDTQVKDIELPSWLIEGMNNAVVKGPVDGSGNPNYGAISTVSTVATFKFVCATVNLELYIDGHYQKVADDNVVNVALVNGADSTHPAANFIYLKKNTGVKQLTAADIGVTSKAPIFGNNQTLPAVYAGADKQYYFNPMTNKWMSSTGSAAYVNDPIVPIAVAVIDNTGTELGKAYWGTRMTPWKVMELFGQGTDGVKHQQTGSSAINFIKQYTSFIVSGGSVVHSMLGSQSQGPIMVKSQAPIVICGSVNGDTLGRLGGAATNNAASSIGANGGMGGPGGGGGGSTARAGGAGAFSIFVSSALWPAAGNTALESGGTTAPTDGAAGTVAVYPFGFVLTDFVPLGGSGGGSGGSDNTNAGGKGGNGAGAVFLSAPGIFVSSTGNISAIGQVGSASAGGNSAGGGGGGGGVVVLNYGYLLNQGTISVAGGGGGLGSGTGKNGGLGGAGILQQNKVF